MHLPRWLPRALLDSVRQSLDSVRSSMVVSWPSSLRQVPELPICTHCEVARPKVVDVDSQLALLPTTFFGSEIDELPPPTYSSPRPNRKCPASCSSTHDASARLVCAVPAPPPSEIEAQSRKALRCRMAVPSNAARTVEAGAANVRLHPSPSLPVGPAQTLNTFFHTRVQAEKLLVSV